MTWMRLVEAVSLRSKCTRQVGAVIVSHEERVIATGYNGPPAGYPAEGTCTAWCPRANVRPKPASYDSCPANHAEMNALLWCSRQERLGGTIYVTTAPCMTCAKAIANSGLEMVVWNSTEEKPHRSPLEVKRFLESCGIGWKEV